MKEVIGSRPKQPLLQLLQTDEASCLVVKVPGTQIRNAGAGDLADIRHVVIAVSLHQETLGAFIGSEC